MKIIKFHPISNANTFKNLAFIVFCLIAFETILFYEVSKNTFLLLGDFYTYKVRKENLILSYLISTISLIFLFLIIFFFSNKISKSKFPVGSNFYILIYYLMCFIINVFLIGKDQIFSSEKSYLGLLTSILPAHLLIVFLFCGNKNIFFFLSLILFFLMFTINSLASGFLIVLYLLSFYYKTTSKNIIIFLLLVPISYQILTSSLELKFKIRSENNNSVYSKEHYFYNHFLARISQSMNLAYIIQNQKKLGKTCFEDPYGNPYEVAIMQVIPKKIFKLENPKNITNCILDTYLNQVSTGSSIKPTFFGSLLVAYNKSFIFFLIYTSFNICIVALVISLFNYLLGNKSMIFNFFVIWQFLSEGTLTALIWTLYFGVTMCLYFILMKPFYHKKYIEHKFIK